VRLVSHTAADDLARPQGRTVFAVRRGAQLAREGRRVPVAHAVAPAVRHWPCGRRDHETLPSRQVAEGSWGFPPITGIDRPIRLSAFSTRIPNLNSGHAGVQRAGCRVDERAGRIIGRSSGLREAVDQADRDRHAAIASNARIAVVAVARPPCAAGGGDYGRS
jgi:hypothetical protein